MSAPTPKPTPEGAYAAQVRADLRVRCLSLMTKEAFVGLPAPHEQAFEADGPIWWCEETGDAFGPDNEPVETDPCHGRCAQARRCYRPPLSP